MKTITKKAIIQTIIQNFRKTRLSFDTHFVGNWGQYKDHFKAIRFNIVRRLFTLFLKRHYKCEVLIDTGNKANTMIPAYVSKLELGFCYTKVKIQKIDASIFQIFRMVLARFLIEKNLEKAQLFQKSFLLANISIKMVLEMLFLIYKNANVLFAKQKLK